MDKNLLFYWQQDLGSPNDLAGWKLYMSLTPGGGYQLFDTIPFVSAQTEYVSSKVLPSPNGQKVTYYFVITAFDNKTPVNESGYSNEAFIEIDLAAPAIPYNLRVIIQAV